VYANNVGGVYSSNAMSICVDVPCHSAPYFYSMGGGKPYPYVLTLKGKPLGRNPMRVNPYVVTLLSAHTVLCIRTAYGKPLDPRLCVFCIVVSWAQ